MGKSFTDIKEITKGKAAFHNVGGSKQVKFAGFKVSPSKPTEEQLAKINKLTRRQFTAEEVYIGQLRLANNCIDRDNERFSEEVITRFAATTIRRTLLFDHNKKSQEAAVGKFFDVEVEKVPLQQARMETGEDLQLPAGITEVWFHSPWFFIPVAGVDEKTIVKLDASIYDWGSIGFRAKDLIPISDKDAKILYWEYRGPGPETEMLEGSLVYLGAQYGMSVKSADNDKLIPGEGKQAGTLPANPNEGGQLMKELLAKLKALYGKTFSEDGFFDELKAFVDEKIVAAVEAAVVPLKAKIAELEPLVKQVADLTPLAADGKAYRDGLVQTFVTLKAKLAECAETPEAQAALKKVVAAYPVDFLKSEVTHLENRVNEKFPAGSETTDKSGDPGQRDKSKGAAAAGKKSPLDPNKDKA